MKTIILTTRTTTKNDWQQYAENISEKKVIEMNYTYKMINIQNAPGKIVLLNGVELNLPPIQISNLSNFNRQENRKQEVDAFLKLIELLSQQENFELNENLIFAIHWGGESFEKSREYTENFKKWVKKYDEKFNFIITFWTTAAATPEPDSEIDENLKEATPDISDETFEFWFNTLKTRDIPLTTKFSNIKHHIMTSFLDLDIDWQGIKEVNEKDKENAKEYLNDILKGKSNNYYCQKLVNLWFYLTGNKDLKIESIHSSLEKDKLPYKKSVLDLINELDNDRKNNLKEKWRNLLSHVGLNVNLNDPNNIEKGKESLIIFYLQNLDLMSQQNKEDKNVNIFLGKFEKKEDSKKEKEIIYFNFHEWYLKLGDLLEELKSFLE
jgi:hypothetical protein